MAAEGPHEHAYLTDFGVTKAVDGRPGHTEPRAPRRHARLHGARADPRRGRRLAPTSTRSAASSTHAHRRGAVPARGHRAQAVGAPLRAAAGARRPVRRRDRARAGEGPARALRERRGARGRGARRRGRLAARRRCSTRRAAASAAIRAAAPEFAGQAAGLLAAFEHAATRAARLHEALADTPPERIERRLAEVRGGHDPGKAKLVAALARHLAVQRRMHDRARGLRRRQRAHPDRSRRFAAACSRRGPRRGRPSAWRGVCQRCKPPGEHRRPAGRDRDDRRDARSRRWGIRHLGKLFAGPASSDSDAMSAITNGCAARGGAASSRSYEFSTALRSKLVDGARELPTAPTSPSTACAAGTSPACTPTTELIGMPSQGRRRGLARDDPVTREYTRFCERAFGRYLHHNPDSTLTNVTMDEITRADARDRRRARTPA